MIQYVNKEDIHFWHYHDEILSDLCQLPDEGIHSLSTRINTIVGKCKFPSEKIKKPIKIMVFQHAVKYHKARDWIWMQDQSALSCQSLLVHCKQLEECCEQFQQAQAQGRAHLTSITLGLSQSLLTTCQCPIHYNLPILLQMWLLPPPCKLPSHCVRML